MNTSSEKHCNHFNFTIHPIFLKYKKVMCVRIIRFFSIYSILITFVICVISVCLSESFDICIFVCQVCLSFWIDTVRSRFCLIEKNKFLNIHNRFSKFKNCTLNLTLHIYNDLYENARLFLHFWVKFSRKCKFFYLFIFF